MSPEDQMPWPQASEDEWLALMGGNRDALQAFKDLAFISHFYDDLIDRDKAVPDTNIHAAFWKLLVAIPTNPFYRAFESQIRPVLICGILNWHAANAMEKTGNVDELVISHVIRHSAGDIALLFMALAVSQEHAAANARRARLLAQTGSWRQYLMEHSNADPHQT